MSDLQATFRGVVKAVRKRWQPASPVKFFIYVASISGIFFLIITPPFQTPDEPQHFMRAYQLSEGNMVIDPVGPGFGGYIPRALNDTIILTGTDPSLQFAANIKYNLYKTQLALGINNDESDRIAYDFAGTGVYPPIPYIPQTAGIMVGKLFSAPPVMLMYLGRLMNLVVWVAMMALAIKLIPRQKWVLVFIALLPSSVFISTSLGVDVMAIGTVSLFLAYILYLRDKNKAITNKQLALLLGIAALMALTKQAMFLFLPLIFLLPGKVFVTKAVSWVARIAIIVVPLLLLLAWMTASSGVHLTDTGNGQDAATQLRYIRTHVGDYINVLWNTFFYTWGDGVTRSLIGVFGWMDTGLSEWLTAVGYAGLAFMLLTAVQGEKVVAWLTRWQKLLVGVVLLAYAGAVSTALYLYYSPIEYKIIVGLQGRYFLPMLSLFIPLVYGKFITASDKVYRGVAMGLPLFLIIASLITLYVRYYVENV